MRALLDGLARYPDGNGFELKQALSRRYGVGMDCIVLGNGSNDVLELAARSFLGAGVVGGLFATCLCGVSAGGAGRRCAGHRGTGTRLRS